jgi:anti-anti-sigma regulatory factor
MNTSDDSSLATAWCDLRTFGTGSPLPFLLVEDAGHVVVVLSGDVGDNPDIGHSRSWSWADTVAGRIVVDASRLRLLNSVLCAWLVNVMRACGQKRLVIIGANARVRETLRLLGLDALIRVSA